MYAFSYKDENEKLVKLKDCPDLPEQMIATLLYTYGVSTTDIINRVNAKLKMS